jgi:hypothetical protein
VKVPDNKYLFSPQGSVGHVDRPPKITRNDPVEAADTTIRTLHEILAMMDVK